MSKNRVFNRSRATEGISVPQRNSEVYSLFASHPIHRPMRRLCLVMIVRQTLPPPRSAHKVGWTLWCQFFALIGAWKVLLETHWRRGCPPAGDSKDSGLRLQVGCSSLCFVFQSAVSIGMHGDWCPCRGTLHDCGYLTVFPAVKWERTYGGPEDIAYKSRDASRSRAYFLFTKPRRPVEICRSPYLETYHRFRAFQALRVLF